MRKTILILVGVMTLTSCSLFKNARKNSNRIEYSKSAKIDSISTSYSKKDISSNEIKVDSIAEFEYYEKETIYKRRGLNAKANIKVSDETKDREVVVFDSAGYKLVAMFNSISNDIDLKLSSPDIDEKVKEKGYRSKNTNSKNNKNSKESNQEYSNIALTRSNEEKLKENNKESVSEPNNRFIVYATIAIVLIVFISFNKLKKPV